MIRFVGCALSFQLQFTGILLKFSHSAAKVYIYIRNNILIYVTILFAYVTRKMGRNLGFSAAQDVTLS